MATIVDRKIGLTGFGLMGLTRPQAMLPQEESFAAMSAALENGATYWNGGEFYGTPEYNTLHLVHEFFTKYPQHANEVVLCVKGNRTPGSLEFDGSEKGVRRSVDECLRVLGDAKMLDIFECARVDLRIPIEETVGVLAHYVKEGRLRGIGLSEVRAETIRRAAAVHKIAQVEVEMSLWATDALTNGVAAACAELDIPLMAYAPLSRGALSGSIGTTAAEIPDHLKIFPRFQPGQIEHNMRMTEAVRTVATRKGCSLPQVAIAWVRNQSRRNGNPVIIPVPGAEKPEWVAENCAIVSLTEDDMSELDSITQQFSIAGERYGGEIHKLTNG